MSESQSEESEYSQGEAYYEESDPEGEEHKKTSHANSTKSDHERESSR